MPFIAEYVYDAPVENVWQALIDKTAMKEWYFDQIVSFEPIEGFEFQFSNDGSTYQKEWIVMRVITGSLLAHSWAYKGYAGNSEVTFELFAEGRKTMLRLTHTGLESFTEEGHFARERFVDGWERILGENLRRYVAHGHYYIT